MFVSRMDSNKNYFENIQDIFVIKNILSTISKSKYS